ncbi:putative Nudix hydrolase NudL [Vibrio scophthalmi]|uniref:CoA pyrophosphatase n=1 Tax=Vibrio scophthalmi TaxID=45658 RepID=UPI000809228C|nr:CoA pyrophosphatase [Vibrio scophthalmi]ANS85666.1 putative Nudix hydrolase NudL [Vibrio scophthalmi]
MHIPPSRQQLIQRFSLQQPAAYHRESLKRLDHLQDQALRKAAVLIGFVERENGLNVLFTKRAAHLKHHPGQVSFPGGKYELEDGSLRATALRETHEEIGVFAQQIEIFGQMPELPTISQFSVTPYLAFIDANYFAAIDHNEVESVFEVPVEIVLDPKHLYSDTFCVKQQHHRVFAINYQGQFIWGMTAQIIHALQNHIMHQC